MSFLMCMILLTAARAQNVETFTPGDIRAAYDVDTLVDAGYTGKGVTVAIVNTGIDSTFYSDVDYFSGQYGLPHAAISLVEPSGPAGVDQESPRAETTIDTEWVHAMAPDAKILLVLTGYQWQRLPDGFSYVIDNNTADIATISPSSFFLAQQGRDALQLHDREYAKSVAENITLIAASGDWGSNNSVNPPWLASFPDLYLIPVYSPYVTVVGGTELTLQSGAYGSETAWNDSGGGPTNDFPEPSWQTGTGVPQNGYRNIPDVALDASCARPYAFAWDVGHWNSTGVCGTSLAAPTFAGIMADIEQAAGRRLGFLNPVLYSLASSDPSVYHDITSGCSLLQSGPSTIIPGYCAHAGWDFVTGWGSIDAARLAKHFAPLAHIATESISSSIHTSPYSGWWQGFELLVFPIAAVILVAAFKLRGRAAHSKVGQGFGKTG